MWQAQWVASQMAATVRGLQVRIEKIKTAGDISNRAPLWEIGGSGLFVRELERALMDGKVDVAVHSMKDLPSATGAGLIIAAVPEREDPRDVLISRNGLTLESLPNGARIGTSSARRRAQLLAYRRDFQIVPLRGNVDTRLRKAEEQKLDAIVLAAAGLLRLGKGDRATEFLSPEICLPAIGQGALAVQVREDDQEAIDAVAFLNHPATRIATKAERAFLQAIGGGCQLPVAALCVGNGTDLVMDAMVGKPDGTKLIRGRMVGPANDAEGLGVRLFQQLKSQGAEELLSEVAK